MTRSSSHPRLSSETATPGAESVDGPDRAGIGAETLIAESPIAWRVSPGLTSYDAAMVDMAARADAIHSGAATERIWLLEHPALYTAGTSARPKELLRADLPMFKTGRGGRHTYHGPGQRICYVQLNLGQRGRDVRGFIHDLESAAIDVLGRFSVSGVRDSANIGVCVKHPSGLAKIAAIGVRVRRWVTLHGMSLNVAPDLTHYDGIIPCGLTDRGITSLRDLGITAEMAEVDAALNAAFSHLFGPDGSGRCRLPINAT